MLSTGFGEAGTRLTLQTAELLAGQITHLAMEMNNM